MAEFPLDNPVEEEEGRPENADPAQTTEERRTEQAGPTQTTQERRTEQAGPTQTTQERRTEQASPTQTTQERRTEQAGPNNSTEEQVQVQEDEPSEQTIESLLDFDILEDIHLEYQRSYEANQKLQEESITISRGHLTMSRGSTSFASNQNRGSTSSASNQNRGSTSFASNQNRGSTSSASNQNRPLVPPNRLGMQQQPPPMMLPTWERLVVHHNYVAGFAPHIAPWGPQGTWPWPAFINQNYAQWGHQNTFHNFALRRHGNAYQAPMCPMCPMMYNPGQFPFGVPVHAPMCPMLYNQNQIFPNAVPAQAPMWPMMYNQQQQFNQPQHFGFPIGMTHQAAPTAAARPPRPEMNHQQMQQLQPQTQQPTQSQGFNAGPSSDQSQD